MKRIAALILVGSMLTGCGGTAHATTLAGWLALVVIMVFVVAAASCTDFDTLDDASRQNWDRGDDE